MKVKDTVGYIVESSKLVFVYLKVNTLSELGENQVFQFLSEGQ